MYICTNMSQIHTKKNYLNFYLYEKELQVFFMLFILSNILPFFKLAYKHDLQQSITMTSSDESGPLANKQALKMKQIPNCLFLNSNCIKNNIF